ncbi:hypothetical protein AB0M44_39625 [Streptosporangium subroseum]|uniref:hypothetical protein n=1 Tax=Streptosporangium subroseum TaxID=106412 RepID=UPI0034463AF7
MRNLAATAERNEFQGGLGRSSAPLRAWILGDCGLVEVVDAAGSGQFVDVVGDAPQDGHDTGQVRGDLEPPGPVRLRTEVHHRRVRLAVQVLQPVSTLADPLHLIIQTSGDIGTARQIAIVDVGILRRGPARRTQDTQRGIEGVDIGIGDDLVDPR